MIKQPNSRHCFMCGLENEISLKMEWYNNPETNQVEGEVVIADHFNSYPGIAHGGVVAAILDETAGRSVLLDGDFMRLFVTAKLEVSYRAPTPTGVKLKAVGRLIRMTKSRALAEADLLLEDGTIVAQCKAMLTKPPAEVMDQWEAEVPFWESQIKG